MARSPAGPRVRLTPDELESRDVPSTIRIVTYNIEADIDGVTTPRSGLYQVLEGIGEEDVQGDVQPPDIITLEETTSNSTTVAPIVTNLNSYYSGIAVYAQSSYQATQSGSNDDGNGPNALVYNTSTLNLLASVGVGTPEGSENGEYRQVVRYEFQPVGDSGSTGIFYVYVSHMKSGTTSEDATDRGEEATIIRDDEASLPAAASVLYTGDLNSAPPEAEFTEFTASGQGEAYDPLNFSTSVQYYSESATDLRYRDDYELMTSNVLNDTGAINYVNGSLHAFANNGTTPSGGSVDSGSDTALNNDLVQDGPTFISASTLYADLTTASDHLPAVADYTIAASTSTTISGFTPPSPKAGQQVTFSGTVTASSGNVPNGETVELEDADNGDAVLASGTTSAGNGTFSIQYTWSSPGTHHVIAYYVGDASNQASSSGQTTVTVTPSVTGISPPSGPAVGGTTVTIGGTGFSSSSTVSFGGNAGTNISYNSSTGNLTATDPSGSGTVDVTVTTNGATSPTSSADKYTYTSSIPTTTLALDGISSATAGLAIETGYNPKVTVDVTPTNGTAAASGSVTIMDTSTHQTVGSGQLTSSGQVTITLDTGSGTTDLQVGNNNLVANYLGKSNFSTSNSGAAQDQVINSLFEVDALTQSATGFLATFDGNVNPSDLTIYGTSPTMFGVGASIDLTVGGTNTQGSLVFDAADTQATFVATGGFASSGTPTAGLLASNTQYNVSLLGVSSTGPVFTDSLGNALAGNGSSAGSNFNQNFTTPTDATEASVNAPYFARGFSQTVNLPNTASTGIPLSITNPSGANSAVTSASFVFTYNPSVLKVTVATLASGFGGSATINQLAGTVTVDITSGSIAAGSTVNVVYLTATVQAAADLKAKEVLGFANIDINGGTNNGLDGSAVHIASFIGDALGNASYSSQDAFLIIQYYIQGGTSGNPGFESTLTAYPLLDPKIIDDVTSTGSVSSQDAFLVNAKFLGSAQGNSAIPNIPSGAGSQTVAVDPKFFLSNYKAAPGSTLTISAEMDVTQSGGVQYSSDGFLIYFNPQVLTVSSVYTAGGGSTADPDSLWTMNGHNDVADIITSSNVVSLSKTLSCLIIGQYWQGPSNVSLPKFADGTIGDLAQVSLQVSSAASIGSRTPLIVGANIGGTRTNFNGSASAVNPAPSNSGGQPIDGTLNIVAPRVNISIQPVTFHGQTQVVNDDIHGTTLTAGSDANTSYAEMDSKTNAVVEPTAEIEKLWLFFGNLQNYEWYLDPNSEPQMEE